MKGLQGRVALVTGAAGGIGQAICSRLVEEGMKVIACDLNADGLNQLTASISRGEGEIYAQTMDITDAAKVTAIVSDVVEQHGSIDLLVNNAGWDVAKPFLETDPDFWNKVWN